jgi:DsbC/DsbD-like thiol-disulfide interchange protein
MHGLVTALFLAAATIWQFSSGQQPPAQRAETAHLVVSWRAPQTVAPGARVSLVVEVTPKPTMHVYAPGQQDLIPISLTIEPTSGVRLRKPEYPKPERYFFAPLKETQLVYSAAFTIKQDVTIDAAQAVDPIKISGTLRYQACDDNVCYMPQSIPVSWSLKLQAK